MSANITLDVNMETILGGVGLAGFIDVVLCGYGPIPPRVVGSGMLADAGIPKLQGPATSFSILLYGNDQITPAGTFYAITIYDDKKQPIQTANYIFAGGPATYQLDSVAPVPDPNPNPPTPPNYITVDPATGAVTVDNLLYQGPIVVIDLLLTGDVVLALNNFVRGQLVQFIIEQDGVGGHALTLPTAVKNPALVNPAASSITTESFIVRTNGNFYPQLGWS